MPSTVPGISKPHSWNTSRDVTGCVSSQLDPRALPLGGVIRQDWTVLGRLQGDMGIVLICSGKSVTKGVKGGNALSFLH